MSKRPTGGNAWTDADVYKAVGENGELEVHRKFANYQGLRDHVHDMQHRGLLKEVHVNRDYRFYRLTEGRSKRR